MSHHTTRSIKKKKKLAPQRQIQVILPLSLKCIMCDLLVIICIAYIWSVGILEIEEDK